MNETDPDIRVQAPGQGQEPDTAVERWRSRLRPRPAKARLRSESEPAHRKRPRTVHEAAEELGLSVHTIRAWVADRRIGYLRLGRAIRIPAEEIHKIIEQSTVPAVRKE